MNETALDHGHFVFSEGAAVPSPLAPNLGLAAFTPATFAGTTLVSNEVDVSAKSDSYEGETTGASAGLLLVGGSNRVYPGNCGAAGSSQGVGVFGDCSPLSYVSTDGLTWTKGSVPRVLEGTTFGICFDPGIDYDKNGTLFYLVGCAPLSGSYPNGIFVASSTNGTAWTAKPHVTFNNNRFFDDKYYIAVDRSNTAFATAARRGARRSRSTTAPASSRESSAPIRPSIRPPASSTAPGTTTRRTRSSSTRARTAACRGERIAPRRRRTPASAPTSAASAGGRRDRRTR